MKFIDDDKVAFNKSDGYGACSGAVRLCLCLRCRLGHPIAPADAVFFLSFFKILFIISLFHRNLLPGNKRDRLETVT